MARTCSICQHDRRLEIDKMLISGKSLSSISRRFGGLSVDSLSRHRSSHLSKRLMTLTHQREQVENLDLKSEIGNVVTKIKAIIDKAESRGQLTLSLKALAELRNTLALLVQIASLLHDADMTSYEERLEQEQRVQADELAQNLIVLTDEELLLLHKLQDKLVKQDPTIKILPLTPAFTLNVPQCKDKSSTFTPIRRRNAGDSQESPLNQVSLAMPRVKVIEPEQIPGTARRIIRRSY